MTTAWVLGDQLTLENPALARTRRVLMVESAERSTRERYHKQKLVLVLAAMREFARELEAGGFEVEYLTLSAECTFAQAAARHPDLVAMEPSDRQTQLLLESLGVELVPTTLFLCTRAEFSAWAGVRPRLRMHEHYVRMRRSLGILVEPDGSPVGGRWSFDAENRKTNAAWRRSGLAEARPGPPEVVASETVEAVARDVDRRFPDHPGSTGGFWLPTTREAARAWLADFVAHRLDAFGPYEDAMDTGSAFLHHSVLSPALNLGLLGPRECVDAALASGAPIESIEGFVRQIIGWREFVNGVYWHAGPDYPERNELGATRPLPRLFETGESELACLRHQLASTERLGWNHHIERLMVLGNFMLLADVDPSEATRWFLARYVDAYDWVMWPNTVGMILHADGGMLASKPYAAGGAYINRMSDHCTACRFDPKRRTGEDACPFTTLYWDFIRRHADRFAENPRMALPVRSWHAIPGDEQRAIAARAREVLAVYAS